MFNNAHFEWAEALVEQERDAAMADARAELEKAGTVECVECEQSIPERRRLAYPSATRCIDCQKGVEQEGLCR
jgi:phage/conjugal plasmid C-4 type zinc finger TraR family protein